MKDERVQQIYEEIQRYTLTLASDPTAAGPRYLQDLIATCRNYVNSVSRILLEVHREKHQLSHDLSGETTLYEVESSELLANDERIKRLPNINDRKASIDVLLRKRLETIARLKRQIQDLDYVEKAVKHRHRELKDTMAEIKLQRSLLRDELDTNAFYGDERTNQPPADDMGPEEIERILAEENAKTTEAPEPKPEESPAVTEDEEQAIQGFLAEGAPPAEKSTDADDYSDIFDKL